MVFLSGCSTDKNTWLSRNSQAISTKYNVFFNANESYKEGINNINKAHVDDYSNIIPLYPISFHSDASAATAQMDRTIEKVQKGIKLHSIKKKPAKDSKRIKDLKYQAFLKQEEYNPMIDESWILLGKAQFHKADFLPAVGTFTYTINHFSWNKECVSEARIWLARSYIEMGWFYDAEDILNKANKDQVPSRLSGIFSATSADLLLKQHRYKEAIPLLTIAAKEEKNKFERTRFNYVLGQLYRLDNNDAQAKYYFTKVIKANPPSEMEFNARISRAEAETEKPDEAIKFLHNMLKSNKYTNYHDKIYYTLGNIFQKQKKYPEAIQNYKLAIDKSSNNIINKVQILVALGDLYYSQSKYLEAQPYYNEATAIMPIENAAYERISKRSQLLDELNQQNEIVKLQDSLQNLSKLTQDQRKASIEGLIKKLQDNESALKKKLLAENTAENAAFSEGPNMKETNQPAGSKAIGSWYFYNNILISGGRTDFQRQWGPRKLEDNWRRQNKSAIGNDENNQPTADAGSQKQVDTNAQTNVTQDKSLVKTDVDFYLQQIPTNETQISKSNEQIANALYKMGMIYKDDLEDIQMAKLTFDNLERRFPKDKRLADVYFNLYQMNMKANDSISASSYKNQIIQKFPESSYAKMFLMPDYAKRLSRMKIKEDSIYQVTYFAYLKNDFQTVFTNYELIKAEYPLTELMPKFEFINALSNGKSGDSEKFKNGLKKIITEYPKSDVSSMAKDILALTSQGYQPQAGGSNGTIQNRRDSIFLSQNQTIDSTNFETNLKDKHFIIIAAPKDVSLNKLQYDVAMYNFTGFMIKDFDLEIKKYGPSSLLVISSLDGYNEALWYQSGLLKDPQIDNFIQTNGCYSFVISESNFQLLKKGHSIDDYIEYYNNNIIQNQTQKIVLNNQNTIRTVNNKKVSQLPVSQTISTSIEIDTITRVPIPRVQKIKALAIQKDTTGIKQQAPNVKNPDSFVFDPTEMHSYGILVLSGSFDFNNLKSTIELYNKSNYPLANYKVTMQEIGSTKLVLVSWLPEANSARTYLFGIIRHREQFEALKGVDYRNVIISKSNLEKLTKSKNVTGYLDFNRNSNMK